MVVNKFGEMNGWNSIKVNLFGRDVEGITGVKYSDNETKENVYGAGKMPIGRSRGNYTAEASITLYKEEADALRWASPVRLQEIAPFDIVVQYVSPSGAIQTDVLRNCEFTNDGVEASQADGSLTTEYVLILSHIDYNVA